jgi:hypothetical protein
MNRTVAFIQEKKKKKTKPDHEPQPGLDTKTDRLTDHQSQRDLDLELTVQFSCQLKISL